MIYSDEEIVPLKLTFNEINYPVYTFNTVIVGSGAASLNAADSLYELGVTDIAVLTDGMSKGISRNCAENTQIIYKEDTGLKKLSDQITKKGSADKDILKVIDSNKERCFYKLADMGIDFNCDSYGNFFENENGAVNIAIASAGMDTAKKISEKLDSKVQSKRIPIFNRYRAIAIIKDTDENDNEFAVGVLAIDRDMQKNYQEQMSEYVKYMRQKNANKTIFGKIQEKININNTNSRAKKAYGQNVRAPSSPELLEEVLEPLGNKFGFVLFRSANIIYGTGGAGCIYDNESTLYPTESLPSLSPAFLAGIEGKNLCESGYGIAAVDKVKWKISDVMVEVIPHIFSVDKDNKTYDFLTDYIKSKDEYIDLFTQKSKNWHFTAESLFCGGESVIDYAIWAENVKTRTVYIDFTQNPKILNTVKNVIEPAAYNKELPEETEINESEKISLSFVYEKTTPYQRLKQARPDIIDYLKKNRIDLSTQPLKINVCMEHLNGGLEHDINFESKLKHFFPIGESSSVFGVHCPKGASLAVTQISALRAALKIYKDYSKTKILDLSDFWITVSETVYRYTSISVHLLKNAVKNVTSENIFESRQKYQKNFTKAAMMIRPINEILLARSDLIMDMNNFLNDNKVDDAVYLNDALINYDILVTQFIFLEAMMNYVMSGGRSRGNYIITENENDLAKFYELNSNFKDFANIKFKYTQKKKIIGNIITKETKEEITEETDYDNLISFIKLKNLQKFETEYSIKKFNET